jgi:hypothetical protein
MAASATDADSTGVRLGMSTSFLDVDRVYTTVLPKDRYDAAFREPFRSASFMRPGV